MGKTNLLEALSFLAPGRGLRRAPLEEVACDWAEGTPPVRWAVAVTAEGANGPVQLSTGLEAGPCGPPERPPPAAGRRVVRVDGKTAASQAALADALAVTWLTPELDRLFMDGAAARRRFLDRLVSAVDAGHLGRAGGYERAMRERARVIRDQRLGHGAADPAWLSALERRMAEHGVALAAARVEFVRRLSGACDRGIGPFPAARVAMAGEVEGWLASGPALEAEERMRAALAADRESERAATGPHRSDLEVVHLGSGRAAGRCSTGEQKALLTGIVLAHARLVALHRGAAPLLLLDEVAAHLDAGRRAALFEEICATGAQAWMTGTDAPLFRPLGDRAQHLHAEGVGVLRRGAPA